MQASATSGRPQEFSLKEPSGPAPLGQPPLRPIQTGNRRIQLRTLLLLTEQSREALHLLRKGFLLLLLAAGEAFP